jgi:hypothetical protein
MRQLPFVILVLCSLCVGSIGLSAQGVTTTASVTTQAPIYLRPGAETPLRVAAVGTRLEVLKEEGEWIEVAFNDPQYGRRVGWVQAKLIRISRPELQPMDLSITNPPPAPVSPAADPQGLAPQPAVKAAPAPRPMRGWIDVNFGAATANETSVTTEAVIPDGAGEFETYRVGYSFPTGASFDVGGGVMVSRVLGFGVQFTGTAHQDDADLFIRIPHPLYFDASATDESVTENALMRVEGGVNLSVVAAPVNDDRVAVRLYGGPTWFRLQADVVNDIRYFQQFGIFTTVNTVEIREYDTEEVEQTGWGFHVGGDVSYFFNRRIGIGGFARYSRGTVTFRPDEFFVSENIDIEVGGFQGGGGLRIRF